MRELTQTWRDIFLGFRIALDPKKMLLGMVFGFLCIAMVMVTVTLFAGETSPLRDLVGETIRNPGTEAVNLAGGIVGSEWEDAAASPSAVIRYGARWLEGARDWDAREWGGIAAIGVAWTLLGLLFWAWFGAPLLRLCGVQYTRDETISFDDACAFAKGKRKSFFFAPLVPLFIVLLMLIPVAIAGLAGRIPWVGPIAVSLFFPLAIFTGLFIVLTLIGGIVGCCLMGPTIAVEGTDAFDAISRAFSYVYQKPWHFIWYWLAALAYGAVCIVFVVLVAMLSIWIPLAVGGWAMGPRFEEIRGFIVTFYALPSTFPLALAAILFKGWIILTYGLALGFIVSYFATQQSIIYCLMRKRVDGTDADEIYLEEEEEEFGGEEPTDTAAPIESEEEKEQESEDLGQEEPPEEAEEGEEEGGEEEPSEEGQEEEEEGENKAQAESEGNENAPAAAKKKTATKKTAKSKKKSKKKSAKKKSTKKKSRKKSAKKAKKKTSGS